MLWRKLYQDLFIFAVNIQLQALLETILPTGGGWFVGWLAQAWVWSKRPVVKECCRSDWLVVLVEENPLLGRVDTDREGLVDGLPVEDLNLFTLNPMYRVLSMLRKPKKHSRQAA
jgi:hypothetical protein